MTFLWTGTKIWLGLVVACGLVMTLLKHRPPARLLLDWFPWAVGFWVYGAVGLVQPVTTYVPDLWTPTITAPGWLNEIMAGAYALMFVFPFCIMTGLQLRNSRRFFWRYSLVLLGMFFVGFAGYLLYPVESPRLAHPIVLDSPWGFYAACERAWDSFQVVRYDAFPSMHTAVAIYSLLTVRHLGHVITPTRPNLLAWIYLPLVGLLITSTLVLRQHYTIDLVAGALLAFAGYKTFRWWVLRWDFDIIVRESQIKFFEQVAAKRKAG